MTSDTAKRRLKLWFFRDLTDEQRMKLIALCGFPTDEGMTQMLQSISLDWILERLAEDDSPPT